MYHYGTYDSDFPTLILGPNFGPIPKEKYALFFPIFSSKIPNRIWTSSRDFVIVVSPYRVLFCWQISERSGYFGSYHYRSLKTMIGLQSFLDCIAIYDILVTFALETSEWIIQWQSKKMRHNVNKMNVDHVS